MHTPSSDSRASVFYDYKTHRYRHPDEMDGKGSAKPVVIVGAGPIGLAAALDLARFGVPSVVLEEDLQVSEGSRAIVLTRRSLEILQQIGVEKPFIGKGLPWSQGRSFYRGKEIYKMLMPHDSDDRYLPGLNIQQQYIEEYLLRYCEQQPLIDIRWGQRVVAIAQDDAAATLGIDTPEGEYELTAEWVVAADGGRSTVRKLMQLRMEGRSYPGHFVIADIKAKINLPTERLCFFDPAWNPGNNVLVHRQPDDLWRIDFRLPDGETEEQALEPTLLRRRINAVLNMIKQEVEWRLDWATVYSANTLTLGNFVHGRVLLTGDAAHLLPIFGVRGINTGLQDSNNMAWKLAFVINRWAERLLLDSYSQERVQAAREICEEGGKSTRFMTPPSPGMRLLRDAVLSFSLSEDFLKDLMHWRTSRPHDYRDSPLNAFPETDREFHGGATCGQPLRNVKLAAHDHLFDRICPKAGFHLLVFVGDDGLTPDLREILAATKTLAHPVHHLIVAPGTLPDETRADAIVTDAEGRVRSKYDAPPGTVYLIRPDLHVCARWRRTTSNEVVQALRRATGYG
ncbi:MAG: FAD-dependent monooxygenase [Steroidobacteraceae bacterium]